MGGSYASHHQQLRVACGLCNHQDRSVCMRTECLQHSARDDNNAPQLSNLFADSYRTCIDRDQLDVTCFFISLFNAQHVSDVNTSILRRLRLICWVISWAVLLWFDVCWCYVVVWLGWCGNRMQAEALLLRSLGLICWVTACVVLLWYDVCWC